MTEFGEVTGLGGLATVIAPQPTALLTQVAWLLPALGLMLVFVAGLLFTR